MTQTQEIGYLMASHGFLRGYCRLCRVIEAVQVCSTASPDDDLHATMRAHYLTAHDGLAAAVRLGSVRRAQQV